MAHARVEELSDSDPDEMDISSVIPHASSRALPNSRKIPGDEIPLMPFPTQQQTQFRDPSALDYTRTKTWQALYPIYFDASRSRAEGRRVNKEAGVKNPLARDIVDAVQGLGYETVFEPAKTHPKDWANPGRVKVDLNGRAGGVVKNSESTLVS